MSKKKRQRKVKLLFCDKCDSPYVTAVASNSDERIRGLVEEIRHSKMYGGLTGSPSTKMTDGDWPSSTHYSLKIHCSACSNDKVIPIASPAVIKDVLSNNYAEVKSPQPIELQWKAFKFAKQKFSKSQVITVRCEDRQGKPYQFKGESSIKVIYGTVRDGWFETRVCWQKYWSRGKGDLGWQTPIFCQRPKIIDKVTQL